MVHWLKFDDVCCGTIERQKQNAAARQKKQGVQKQNVVVKSDRQAAVTKKVVIRGAKPVNVVAVKKIPNAALSTKRPAKTNNNAMVRKLLLLHLRCLREQSLVFQSPSQMPLLSVVVASLHLKRQKPLVRTIFIQIRQSSRSC